MLPVLGSGVPLSLALVERGRPLTAIFLGYILLLTGSACWSAWRAIRDRNHRARYFGPMYWILTVLVGAAGLGVAILGPKIGAPLFHNGRAPCWERRCKVVEIPVVPGSLKKKT